MIELIVCTIIWGAAFLAQKLGANNLGAFSINCYRNVLAGIFLAIVILLRNRRQIGKWNANTVVGGAISGLCLFLAMMAQQLGIEHTTPGVSAFLTANYVLLVPVLSIFVGRKAGLEVWGGVAMALLGTFFICFPQGVGQLSGVSLGRGEAWTLVCAAMFAVQIMVVDRFSRNCDMVRFSMVQMFVAGLIAFPFVFLPSEMAKASWAGFVRSIPALLFLGVFSSGIAYTLQCLGQAKVSAALASIIMSMESVFALMFGWLVFGDLMSCRQLIGCLLVLAAVVFSQLWCLRKRDIK